jgi:hypothetical protein
MPGGTVVTTGASAAAGPVAAGTSVVGHVVGSVIGIGINAVFNAAGQWVAAGAVWLLTQVSRAMSATTSVDLTSGWFSSHVSVMASLSAAVVLPMVLCATIQALYRQSASMLAKAFLVQLPLALLLTGVAVELVQMAMAVTDALSADVLASAGVDAGHILSPMVVPLAAVATKAPLVPTYVVFFAGVLVSIAALLLWLELVVRAAAVSVAVLFLPLALAALVWPAISHWCRRLAETLAALVLSKLVIAAVLSLAAGALAGGIGVGATGGDGGGFAAVITGVALLVIATMSPYTLLRLIPAVEAGAVAHLESGRSQLMAAPGKARNEVLDIQKKMVNAAEAVSGALARVGTSTAAVDMAPGVHTKGMPGANEGAGAVQSVAGGAGSTSGGAGAGGGTPAAPTAGGPPPRATAGGGVEIGTEAVSKPLVAGSAVSNGGGSWKSDQPALPNGEDAGPNE